MFLTTAANLAAGVQQQPHLVLIVGDDMGANDVGYSDPFLMTPAIDNLANDGVKFSTLYTWNWCAPSRGSLLTGRYVPNHGFENGGDGPELGVMAGLPTEFELLPSVLSKLGYATAMVGKWRTPVCGSNPPRSSRLARSARLAPIRVSGPVSEQTSATALSRTCRRAAALTAFWAT